jgi:putative transposase
VLAWRISNTQKAGVCVDALNETINRFGAQDIMNTNRGPPFTSFALTDRLKWAGACISTDGKHAAATTSHRNAVSGSEV